MTTNPSEERKGSDGVHVRWIAQTQMLEIIFAEAKLWGAFDKALEDAFVSMTAFHNSATKPFELTVFLNSFSDLPAESQQLLHSYVTGKNKERCREVHACLIGHTWDEYQKLQDPKTRSQFIADFRNVYRTWASTTMRPLLQQQLDEFTHQHLRLEFFFLPFKDVSAFRYLFSQHLGLVANDQ